MCIRDRSGTDEEEGVILKAKKCGRNAGEIRDIGLEMQGGESMSLAGQRGRSASRMPASGNEVSMRRKQSDGPDGMTRQHGRISEDCLQNLASMSLFKD